jgi:hypothetical protein
MTGTAQISSATYGFCTAVTRAKYAMRLRTIATMAAIHVFVVADA